MKITYSTGRKNKIHISIDGEYRLTTDVDFWFSLGVHNNDEMSEEEVSELIESINMRRAYNKGIDLLSLRAHSKKELIDKIKRTSEEKYAIIAVGMLEEKGYMNDEDFARDYYSFLKNKKKFGKSRIMNELYRKGIDKALSSAIAEEYDDEPREAILELLRGKYSSHLADEKGRKRTFNALVRMGYNFSDIRSAMSEYNDYCEE